MREYKFRGLRLDGRGWAYGDLVHMASGAVHIVGRQIGEPWLGQPVDAKTVGQYIGRQDIRGCDVYEGDNVQISDGYDGTSGFGTVGFSDSSFRVNEGGITYYRWMDYDVEVIGNIHEAAK